MLRLGALGVVKHDVVRVDQPDDHERRLAARLVAAHEIENAARGVAGDIHVGAVAVPCQAQFLAVEAIIVKAVFLHRPLGAGIDAAGHAVPVAIMVDAAEVPFALVAGVITRRSEEHTSELQSLMRISYAVFCLKKKTTQINIPNNTSY